MLSATNLRTLGYLKISNLELNIENIIQLNTELCGSAIRPWSYLNVYQTRNNNCPALVELIQNEIRYVGGIAPVDSEKRAFRNTWDNIWSSYCKALGLDKSVETILSDVGLIVSVTEHNDAVTKQVIQFYNDIISWYNFTKRGNIDVMETLKILVVGDTKNIRGYITR